ncbi:MAG: site-specific tyrosine recombinase XerD [Lachnospiraceae bacterium]|nr:site-specific tyrosine recombinase XerD [Lachnospiraceae bacterium]
MREELDGYIVYLKEVKSASDNTVASYHSDLKMFYEYLEEQEIETFSKVTETVLNSYFLGLEKQGLSPASVNRKMVTVRNYILYLIKKGKLATDPMERIKAPKFKRKEPESISVEEINALLATPDGTTEKGIRDKAMLELLYATGMKVSELLDLKQNDLNLKLNYVVVRESAGERLLPIGKTAKEAISRYLNESGMEEASDSYLFVNRRKERMTRQGFIKILKQYAKDAGIEKEVTPQIIRNSFAMHLLENGADLQSLQELLGHGDISATQYLLRSHTQKTLDVYAKTHPRA